MKHIASAILLLSACSLAWSQAVITLPGGQVSVGVGQFGQLGAGSLPTTANNTSTTGGGYAGMQEPMYGIFLTAQNADGIAPGCFCEGWGVSANGVAGYAANQNGGNSNITGVSFSSTATTATSVVTLTSLPALQVSQSFAPAAGATTSLFRDAVTITNTGATTLTNLQYARAMDWDINPTEFSEIVTIGGVGASALTFSNDDGFCTPNPLTISTSACTQRTAGTNNVNFTKLGPADQGALFVFSFGNLAAGASKTFYIYYGAATGETNAIAGLTGVGAEVYSLGYASNGAGGTANTASGVWIFGFSGVGGTPIGAPPTVPALSDFGLVLLAVLLVGVTAYKMRSETVTA